MTNGKWLLLIFFIGLIVLTFFIMKEYKHQTPDHSSSSEKEGYLSICEDIIVNDKTTVDGKTFTPPARGSPEMKAYMNFLSSVGIIPMETDGVHPMARIGNYVDGYDRRIPLLITSDRTSPEECAQKVKSIGLTVAGTQWQGECWGGNDINRAKSFGKSQFDNPANPGDFDYGRPWNNLVMTDVPFQTCSINAYSKYVSELLNNNITTYDQLKLINRIEGFVEGATTGNTPGSDYPPGSSPMLYSDYLPTAQSLGRDLPPWFALKKEHVEMFRQEVGNSQMSLQDFLILIRNILSGGTNTISLTSDDIVLLRTKLTNIGFQETGDGIVMGVRMFGNLRIFKPNLEMSNFEDPYKKLAKNGKPAPGDFNKIYDFAMFMRVSDDNQSNFTMEMLSGILTKNNITIDQLDTLKTRLTGFYATKNDAKAFIQLVNDVMYYDRDDTGSWMDKLKNMRSDLEQNNVPNYMEYVNIRTLLKSNTTVDHPLNMFIHEFYQYYTSTDADWFNAQSAGPKMPLRAALELFMDFLKTNAAEYNTQVNLYNLVKYAGNDENIKVQDMTQTSLGKRSVLSVNELSTTRESFVEGAKSGTISLAHALGDMGVKNVNKIQVSPNLLVMNEKQFVNYLVNKMPDLKNEQSRIDLIGWMASLGMIQTDIESFFSLLRGMGISSYADTMGLKAQMKQINISALPDIKEFLQAMGSFGVQRSQLDDFLGQLNKFGLSMATDRKNAYAFLKLMKNYDITYMKSDYDPCLTKFSIFIGNLTEDNITFPLYSLIIVPLLKMLNNGVEPSKPPANKEERVKLNRNMRDLIIRREKTIYTGGDLESEESGGFSRCNKTQFPDLKGYRANKHMKDEKEIYQSLTEQPGISNARNPGGRPPFLYELNNNGNVEPTVHLNDPGSIEKIPNNYPVNPAVIKQRLFYATVIVYGPHQREPALRPIHRHNPPLHFEHIVANLTHYEYAQFQTGRPNLIVSSVMSRLYAKLASHAKTHLSKQDYQGYNSKLDTLNFIRSVPYYTFRLIAREIAANPHKYDDANDTKYRLYSHGVKPFFPEDPNIQLDGYNEPVDMATDLIRQNRDGKHSNRNGPIRYGKPSGLYKKVVYESPPQPKK